MGRLHNELRFASVRSSRCPLPALAADQSRSLLRSTSFSSHERAPFPDERSCVSLARHRRDNFVFSTRLAAANFFLLPSPHSIYGNARGHACSFPTKPICSFGLGDQ